MSTYILEGEYVLINALIKGRCDNESTNGLTFFGLRTFCKQIRRKNPRIYVDFSDESISLAVCNHPEIFKWNDNKIVSTVNLSEIKIIAKNRYNRFLPKYVLETLESIT